MISLVVAAAVMAACLWMYAGQPRMRAPVVLLEDGKTLDFSGGRPVVRDGPADKAALDAAVKAMDDASRAVTFPADPAPKK